MEINKLSLESADGAHHRRDSIDLAALQSSSAEGALAGVYLGILNLFTTLPQFIGTFISMLVFHIFEPGHSPELHEGVAATERQGPNAIGICLFVGALCALGAAYATHRLRYVR